MIFVYIIGAIVGLFIVMGLIQAITYNSAMMASYHTATIILNAINNQIEKNEKES